MHVLIRVMGFLKPYRLIVMAAALSTLGMALCGMALPKLLGEAIDQALREGNIQVVVYFALGMIAFACFRGAFAFTESYLREYLGHNVGYDIRNAIYDHLQRLSFAYHDKQQTGELMSRATADVESIRNFVSFGLIRAGYMVSLLIAISIMLVFLNPKLTLIVMALVPVLIIRATTVGIKLREVWTHVQEITGQLGAVLQESMTGIRVVKAFARQDYENRKYSAKSLDLARESLASVRIEASNNPFMNFVFALMLGAVLWFGAREMAAGQLTEGELAQFLLYVAMLEMPVRMSGWVISRFTRAASSGTLIFEILDAKSPVRERPDATGLRDSRGEVTFDNVSFAYEARSPVLEDINFTASPGQVVAVLGATGSGKTTLMQLLLRFYDVDQGRILLDGTDIRDTTFESLRSTVGIVQQDLFLFSATVRDNVAYGAVAASEERVRQACRIARLDEFITSLPQGYGTWVGERGITLSGGQKQRVAIARTLLRDPAVLVLDDSTSSVDTATEHLIREALADLIKGRTTFVIAQRLSTVKAADTILVLDNGHIAQRGTHSELLAEADGIYRSIYEMQLRPQEEAAAMNASATLAEEGTSVG